MTTLFDLEDNDQTNHNSNNNKNAANETNDNIDIYQNHQHRQPVNSTELTQNSDPLKTTLSTLPNITTPLPRLQRQNSVLFNTEPIMLNNSTQPTLTNNQIFNSLHNN